MELLSGGIGRFLLYEIKANNVIEKILIEHYNIQCTRIKKLDGYENENFLIVSNKGKYVLKTYLYSDALMEIVRAEREILLQIKGKGKYAFPMPVMSNRGGFEFVYDKEEQSFIVRLLTFVEGYSISFANQTKGLYESFGRFLGEMDSQLMKIDNSAIRMRKSEWNIVNFKMNKKLLAYIVEGEDKMLLENVFSDFETIVEPRLPALRHCIIHNDANDFNVLTNKDVVTGIIDFGDLAYAPLIDELGVAIAYAGFGKDNPYVWAKIMIESYDKVIPLQKKELEVLYYIVAARLTTTIVNAAYGRITNPQNKYTYTSEKDAWSTLRRWLKDGGKVIG